MCTERGGVVCSHTPLILHARKLGLTPPWACSLGGQSSNRIYSLWGFSSVPRTVLGVPTQNPTAVIFEAGTVTILTLQMRRPRHKQAGHLPKAIRLVGRGPGVKPEQSGSRAHPRNQQRSPKAITFLSWDVVLALTRWNCAQDACEFQIKQNATFFMLRHSAFWKLLPWSGLHFPRGTWPVSP